MDQSTKQRLVGAIVLVGAILWLVPVFLDGPSTQEPTISETVQLPGVELGDNQRETINLERRVTDQPPPEAVPAKELPARQLPAEETSKPEPESKPEPAKPEARKPAVEPEEKPPAEIEKKPEPAPEAKKPAPPVESPVATKPAASGGQLWAVQIGSFSAKENAERLAADLRKEGVAAFLTTLDRSGKTLHRVRVGPVESARGRAGRWYRSR
ncbi:MAG: SPOR domain-containing protein [Pseudomonadota bacterium]